MQQYSFSARVGSPLLSPSRMSVRLSVTLTPVDQSNKKAVLPQGNRAMPQVFFSVEVRQQHSLQV